MSNELLEKLKENVIQGRKSRDDVGIDENLDGTPGVVELVHEAIAADIPVQKLITEGLTSGMDTVGQKFSSGEYFIPDMLASAEAVDEGMKILRPLLEKAKIESRGRFLIATVKGDIHDIGKNIVAILLRGAGYEVNDIGIDVSEETIVEAVKKEAPDYLGLSALLTTTMMEMPVVLDALKEAGLRDKIKVLIGGAAVSDEFAAEIGADAFCADGFSAISTLKKFERAS
jgi:5-methyltetrahydrofolate--homocysteine methyltransferase